MPIYTTIQGTTGDDTIYAPQEDVKIFGRQGADTYVLDFSGRQIVPGTNGNTTATNPNYLINEGVAGDAASDTLTGFNHLAVYNYAQQSYDVTRFVRYGADGQHLRIDTAAHNKTVYDDGFISGTVRIIKQYNPAAPNAFVEQLTAGNVSWNMNSYSFAPGDTGGADNDIITGWKYADTLSGGDGNDFISGGGRRDHLYGDNGNDTLLGDGGSDYLYGGRGEDLILGDKGNDRAWGGDGNDVMLGGVGKDVLRGGDGDDTLFGEEGNDRLIGGRGMDILSGGSGDDVLSGQRNRDIYRIDTNEVQTDTIMDKGAAASATLTPYSLYDRDSVELLGFGSVDEAIHNVQFEVSGDDLIITYTNPNMAAGAYGTVVISGQFSGAANHIEMLMFEKTTGLVEYSSGGFHIEMLSGDANTYSVHNGSDVGGQDLVLGTTGDDEIYGGINNDIMSGEGGADVFMFHDEESNSAGQDIILDFDLADDRMDFTEIVGLTAAGVTVADNSWGNAVVSSAYFSVELAGVSSAAVVAADIFDFA